MIAKQNQAAETSAGQWSFVVAAGTWRILLLGPLLALAVAAFFILAVVLLVIDLGTLIARIVLWLLAVAMIGFGILVLLLCLTFLTRIEVGTERLKIRAPRWRGPLAWIPWIRAHEGEV